MFLLARARGSGGGDSRARTCASEKKIEKKGFYLRAREVGGGGDSSENVRLRIESFNYVHKARAAAYSRLLKMRVRFFFKRNKKKVTAVHIKREPPPTRASF